MNSNSPISVLTHPNDSHSRGWAAALDLRFALRGARSTLVHRAHHGPLRVQKALYPEGDAVCQVLVLHPPAGIAGGDLLHVGIAVEAGAHAQLTTPGAGKWYRSSGATARQTIHLAVAAGACLEWLPQEAIVFDAAQADTETVITLAQGGRCIGWDIVCLGRSASGEQFSRGRYRQRLRLQRPDGQPLWRENLCLQGSDPALHANAALARYPVFGTLWLAGWAPDAALTERLRALPAPDQGAAGVTALPQVSLVRAVAHSAQALRHYFEAVWALAREPVLGRSAQSPRIWQT